MTKKTKIKTTQTNTDSLLQSLVYLTKHFGKSKSASALTAGLPYAAEGMTPTLFLESANRIGLNAKKRGKKELKTLSDQSFPCIALMKGDGNKCLVLLAKDGANLSAFNPETNQSETFKISEVQKQYSGQLIYIHPDTSFHDPAQNIIKTAEKHWFWGLLLEHKKIYINVAIAAIFINLFALTSPLFVMNVYDRVIPNNAIETGWILGIAALVIYVFDFIIRTLRGYFIDIAGRRTEVVSAQRIFGQVLNMNFAERPASGGVFASILREFDSVKDFMASVTLTAVVDLPFTLLFLIVIYIIGGPIALILIALIAIIMITGYAIQYPLKNIVKNSIQSGESRHGVLVEAIQMLETIKAIGADGRVRARYGDYVGENAKYAQQSRFISAIGINLASFVQQTATIFIVLAGMYLVQTQDLTVGGLIAVVIISGRALAPIGQIASLAARYHQAANAFKTIDALMQAPVERPADKHFLHRPDLDGNIRFDRVDFSYPNAGKTLDQASFEIKKGERVGVIGRIGSGKSTIAKLIMRIYEPQNGALFMDDTDYRQIDPADLRRNIGYIPQDVSLFRGTVRDNITASLPRASEEDILEASKAAGVHDFISHHPMGYDAPVGEGGLGLSGGQRQAIALARALLLKPKILVCDEPTNAMDNLGEAAFARQIHKQAQNLTFVLITHRTHLLKLVDRLIFIDQGKITLDGPRDEVLKALQNSNTPSPTATQQQSKPKPPAKRKTVKKPTKKPETKK